MKSDECSHASARCRHCSAVLGTTFVDLGHTPLCQTHIESSQLDQQEPYYPLHAWICSRCLLVQLEAVVPPQSIFKEYAYFSSYSDSWVQHAERYCQSMIERFGLDSKCHRVFEVASNDGYLLKHFLKRGFQVLGIEPAENVAEVAIKIGITTECRFLGAESAAQLVDRYHTADLVVANNVLAHVPDLDDFVTGIRRLLAPEGIATFEFPHLIALIEGNQFDTIYHEHYSYLSFYTAEAILRARGLVVFDVERLSTHGGSLRLFVSLDSSTTHVESPRVNELRHQEQAGGYDRLATYLGFESRVAAVKNALMQFLTEQRNAGRQVVGYGAPGKGNTLLNYCGIDPTLVHYTVDKNVYKQGKYTPGARLPIYSPEKITETKPDYVLVLPWNLSAEIILEHRYISEWGGRFVIPIPALKVVEPPSG